jgi:surface polysaccharide O-acyltransferase-like enzyme
MNNKRKVYLDILNILACIAVIAIHCNGIVYQYDSNNSMPWKTSLIVETVCFWAVPVFLMITGANLMNYREKYDTKTFFKKRMSKVVIPFAFWIVVMIIWKMFIGELEISKFSLKNILNIIFTNQEESTYYFLFLIMGIYLTLPLLSYFSKEEYRNILWYTVLVMFITKSVLPVVLKIFGISYNNDLSIQLGIYIIFVILGYLLSTQDIKLKYRIVIYILGILSVIFRYGLTYYWTIRDGVVNKTLFAYEQFHSVLLACAVFIFVKNIKFSKKFEEGRIPNILMKVSSCTFGIYLIHQIVMLYEMKILNISQFAWQWRTFGAISTYLICLAIIYVMKKIPLVKKIVP